MNRLLKTIALRVAALVPVRLAENMILAFEDRIGIGSGAGAGSSGESVVFELLSAIDSEDLTIFDVGANQGQYASEASAHLAGGREFAIHCFEPSKNTFRALVETHKAHPKITLNNFGLSDRKAQATLFMETEGSGLASLTKRRLGHFGIPHGRIEEAVELDTLTSYCAQRGIQRIHLLKIDVEGHELDVLSGARPMLENRKIDLVQFEFGGTNIDTRTYFQDFFYFFDSLQFELFRILPSRKLLRLPEYRELDEKFRTANYLAASKALNLTQNCGRFFV